MSTDETLTGAPDESGEGKKDAPKPYADISDRDVDMPSPDPETSDALDAARTRVIEAEIDRSESPTGSETSEDRSEEAEDTDWWTEIKVRFAGTYMRFEHVKKMISDPAYRKKEGGWIGVLKNGFKVFGEVKKVIAEFLVPYISWLPQSIREFVYKSAGPKGKIAYHISRMHEGAALVSSDTDAAQLNALHSVYGRVNKIETRTRTIKHKDGSTEEKTENYYPYPKPEDFYKKVIGMLPRYQNGERIEEYTLAQLVAQARKLEDSDDAEDADDAEEKQDANPSGTPPSREGPGEGEDSQDVEEAEESEEAKEESEPEKELQFSEIEGGVEVRYGDSKYEITLDLKRFSGYLNVKGFDHGVESADLSGVWRFALTKSSEKDADGNENPTYGVEKEFIKGGFVPIPNISLNPDGLPVLDMKDIPIVNEIVQEIPLDPELLRGFAEDVEKGLSTVERTDIADESGVKRSFKFTKQS